MSTRSGNAGLVRNDGNSPSHGVNSQQTSSLSDAEYKEICSVIREMTGITMGSGKQQLIYRRLSGRLKATGIPTFREYMNFLQSGQQSECEHFTNAITTNLTSYFREQHHFEFLADTIIPETELAWKSGVPRLRIWSAGCSTGEEPYSIAITLRESLLQLNQWDARILATDLDTDVLNQGKTGIYPEQRVDKIPKIQLRRWFRKESRTNGERVKVARELQELITFKQLNLMHDWPMHGPFDVIFCRNVIIYFDKQTQRVLMDRFANILKDGGYLILGHSESLFNVTKRFELLGKTIYRKIS